MYLDHALTISPIRPSELAVVSAIADAALGKDFLSRKVLMRLIEQPWRYTVLAARDERGVQGFCYGSLLSATEALEQGAVFGLDDGEANGAGMLHSIAIRPWARGKGVGSALVQQLLARLQSHGAQSCRVLGWKQGKTVNIQSVLLRAGFRQRSVLPLYWYHDSRSKGYSCPQCGHPPCCCTAVAFTRELTAGAGISLLAGGLRQKDVTIPHR